MPNRFKSRPLAGCRMDYVKWITHYSNQGYQSAKAETDISPKSLKVTKHLQTGKALVNDFKDCDFGNSRTSFVETLQENRKVF